jgi:membrane fusion protein (multidrug efflux system)
MNPAHACNDALSSPIDHGPRFVRVARIAIVVAACAAALSACGKDDKKDAGPPQPLSVTVVTAKTQRFPVTVETVGQSEGSKEIQVRSRVSGILLKQRFTEGDRVKAGVVLYQVDPVPYQIALAQAQAALAQARASSEQAEREQKRLKPLAEEQAVSGKDYDDATSTTKTTAAQVMARVADVHNAELNLGYTQVIAPIGGITGRNISSEGSLVTVNTDSALLTTIVQTDPIWVRFSIGESEFAQLRSNNGDSAKVELVLPDGKSYPEAGKLNFAASTVDRTLGTVQLRAEVANPALRILPGQFVKARLYIGEIEGVLVPQVAVSSNSSGKSVMVVDQDNKAAVRPVSVGSWQGDQWVVTKGLAPGDRVIVDNLVKLHPGSAVAPHPPQAQGAPAPQQGNGATPPPAADAAKPAPDDAAKADGQAKQ